jgi:hypothetical protein
VGDETMSVLEIWGAEYQEQVQSSESVFLSLDVLQLLCEFELHCSCSSCVSFSTMFWKGLS